MASDAIVNCSRYCFTRFGFGFTCGPLGRSGPLLHHHRRLEGAAQAHRLVGEGLGRSKRFQRFNRRRLSGLHLVHKRLKIRVVSAATASQQAAGKHDGCQTQAYQAEGLAIFSRWA